MTRTVLRIVVVDDHQMFREGVAAMLGGVSGLRVVAGGATSDDAESLVRDLRPDYLVLDVEIPGRPARTTISRIRRCCPGVRVVVLTMHRDPVLRRSLLAAGANAFVTKSSGITALTATIGRLERDGAEAAGAPAEAGQQQILTDREMEVLRLVAQARSNHDIAEVLSIAEGTVKRHTNNMYAKLGARSRVDAVRIAYRLGLFEE